jgi:hypothetical protein
MAAGTVKLTVSFDALIEAITTLSLEEKQRLLDVLEEQVGQAEEEAWEQDPAFRAELQEARDAYEAGDYVTLDDYLAEQKDTTGEA